MDVGFVGLGAMGSRMAARLAESGHAVTAWNRSEVEAPPGVKLAPDPAAVAAAAGSTFVMVAGPQDVEDVIFGSSGCVEGAGEGSVLIQSTTIGPAAARSIGQRLQDRGVAMIDAPVGGSTGPAATGELVVLAGGDAEDVARVQPLLDVVGAKTVVFGGIGSGSAVKLLLNAVLLASMATAAETWAWLADSEPDLRLEQVAGALERISPMVARRMPDIAGDPPPPGFAVRHAAKDLGLAVAAAGDGIVLPATLRALADAEASGFGDADIAALGASARRRRS